MAILEGNEPILTDAELKRHRVAKKASEALGASPKAKMLNAGIATAKGTMKQAGESVTNLGSVDEIPSLGDLADDIDQSAPRNNKFSLRKAVSDDMAHTKNFASEVSGILSGKKAQATAEMGAEAVDSLADLKKAGGEYLSNMGGGSKTLGGAKVGAYMVGASMLADFLNPFDND